MANNANHSDEQYNWNTHMAKVANNELLLNNKGVVTGVRFYNCHTQTDKYCLELQTQLEGEKYVWLKITVLMKNTFDKIPHHLALSAFMSCKAVYMTEIKIIYVRT